METNNTVNALMPFCITVGSGKKNPGGQRLTITMPQANGTFDLVTGYLEAINNIPSTTEAWFGTHTWKNDYRNQQNWMSAWGVGVDLDYEDPDSTWVHPGTGKVATHCPMPSELTHELDRLATTPTQLADGTFATSSSMPGSIYYPTHRGIRLIYVFKYSVGDPETFVLAAKGAGYEVQQWLDARGLAGELAQGRKGLVVDQKVLLDTGRMLYAPKAMVGGHQRDAKAVALDPKPYSLDTLEEWGKEALKKAAAAKPATTSTGTTATTAPTETKEEDSELEDAIKRHNADYLAAHGRWAQPGQGKCLLCGHEQCFGYLPEDPDRWYCFSANHEGGGRQKEGSPGFYGDALDIAMAEKGWTGTKTRAAALKELKDPQGKPYLSKKYQEVNFKGLRVQDYIYDMRTKKYRSRDPETGKWRAGHDKEAFTTFLAHEGLNGKSIHTFLVAVRPIHEEVYQPNNPEEFTSTGKYTVLNSYRPSTLKPEKGDWSPIEQLLLNLCSGKKEYVSWYCEVLARMLQDLRDRKYERMGISVTMFGKIQGAGKNVFANVLKPLFGPDNVLVIDQAALENGFNNLFQQRLIIIGNEVFSGDTRKDQATANKLKSYVTDETYILRLKFLGDTVVENPLFWMFFSNDPLPIKLERDDRRSCVFQTQTKILPSFGGLISEDAKAGGPIVRAFLYHLLYEVKPTVERYVAISTAEKTTLIKRSGNSAEKFAEEIKERGIYSDVIVPWQQQEIDRWSRNLNAGSTTFVEAQDPMITREKDGVRGITRSTMNAIYKAWAKADPNLKTVSGEKLYDALRAIAGLEDANFWHMGKSERVFINIPGDDQGFTRINGSVLRGA